jgi:uncharacterized membrane-anchored protein YhcB (DUF1043 family)
MLGFFNQIAVMPWMTALLPFLTVGIVLGVLFVFGRMTKELHKRRGS